MNNEDLNFLSLCEQRSTLCDLKITSRNVIMQVLFSAAVTVLAPVQ